LNVTSADGALEEFPGATLAEGPRQLPPRPGKAGGRPPVV